MPTVITMIPMVVLYIRIVSPVIYPVLEPVWQVLPLFTGVAINTVVMFLLVMLNRYLSKAIFQNIIYQDDKNMPTTDFLMPNHKSLDKASRTRYYTYILQDYGIDMQKSLKCLRTDDEKRIMIARVVGQIRETLRGNRMILQHNIEYGFFRNLLGGCTHATLISIVLLCIAKASNDSALLYASLVMMVVYLLPLFFSKHIIKYHGQNYAKVLFEQYGVMDRST